MPTISWEWKLTPQILVSVANFTVLFIGVVGMFYKMNADIAASQQMTLEAKAMIEVMRTSQSSTIERLTKVETKVDLMLPTLQRIEMNVRPAHP